MRSSKRRDFLKSTAATAFAAGAPFAALAQDDAVSATLIRGAAIFDGKNPDLITGSDVLIQGGMVAAIGPNLAPEGARTINADGRVLTPGLTDAHTHIMWNDSIEELIYTSPHEYAG